MTPRANSTAVRTSFGNKCGVPEYTVSGVKILLPKEVKKSDFTRSELILCNTNVLGHHTVVKGRCDVGLETIK